MSVFGRVASSFGSVIGRGMAGSVGATRRGGVAMGFKRATLGGEFEGREGGNQGGLRRGGIIPHQLLHSRGLSGVSIGASSNTHSSSTGGCRCKGSSSYSTETKSKNHNLTVHFENIDASERLTIDTCKAGDTILDVALEHDIDIEGACDGTLACSTCHVIVKDDKYFDRLPEPEDEELDMLDLAIGVEARSRLGCQIVLDKGLDGITLVLPEVTADAR
eukprot:Nk52_evm1s2449 gene=Nk52_evmTU1s2449